MLLLSLRSTITQIHKVDEQQRNRNERKVKTRSERSEMCITLGEKRYRWNPMCRPGAGLKIALCPVIKIEKTIFENAISIRLCACFCFPGAASLK